MNEVYRAPMRARDRDEHGADVLVDRGLVGIAGGQGEKADRMLRRFAELPDGVFVWTRDSGGGYWLGRMAGPYRHEDSDAGIPHVRPARWMPRPFGEDEVPAAVAATFARGGRNFQRIRGAEGATPRMWESYG